MRREPPSSEWKAAWTPFPWPNSTPIKGVSLAFAGMRDMVSDMFKLSGFLTILSVHPDVPSALSALK